MKPLHIAVEYERGLHNQDFTVTDVAPTFLSHPLNINEQGETKYFHQEGTLHQTEFNSLPHLTIPDLCRDFLEAEELSDKIGAELGVVNVPISETGAGLAKINPAVMHRVHGYQTIFGKDAVDRLIRISGIHLHVDQYKERLADQFNALTALRPTIAFTSTSALTHKGENNLNCHRYNTIADPKKGVFAAIPEERGYITLLEELQKRDRERHSKWASAFDSPWNRHKNKDLPLTYNFRSFLQNFTIETTGYPDVRFRPGIGQGTYELRINDSVPLDIVIAQAALVSGYINQIMLNQIPVTITEDTLKDDGKYQFHKNAVILPNIETLDHLTYVAMNSGLRDPQVQEYLSALYDFAKNGLPVEEQHYLQPYAEMLSTGQNLATQIMRMLGHQIIYSPQDGALANKFIWEKHQQAVQVLRDRV